MKTRRQQVHGLMLTKAKYREIALMLGITFWNTKHYARSVLAEAGVTSRVELLVETFSNCYRDPTLRHELRSSDHDVMLFLLKGYTARATSEGLGIALTEVNVARQRIMDATGAISVIDLVHTCYGVK